MQVARLTVVSLREETPIVRSRKAPDGTSIHEFGPTVWKVAFSNGLSITLFHPHDYHVDDVVIFTIEKESESEDHPLERPPE